MQCNYLILWRVFSICLLATPVLWYMYSPMDTGPVGPYQVTLLYQISHCRSKAIGDSPWTLRYSRPIGMVGHL